jgi:hypothetical protein
VIDPSWIKDYGLIKARLSGGGDGNLPLYTAVTLGLYQDVYPIVFAVHEQKLWADRIGCAYFAHELSPGLTRRTPTDTGQETWDNLLGWIALSLIVGQPFIARRIVRHALTHAFFFNTNGQLSWSDFQGRHVHLWLLAIPAAFPFLRPTFRPLLRLIGKTLNANHPGGVILDWVWMYSAHLMGMTDGKLGYLNGVLAPALMDQMDHDQPAVGFAKELV